MLLRRDFHRKKKKFDGIMQILHSEFPFDAVHQDRF
jgi:hypothetical protein